MSLTVRMAGVRKLRAEMQNAAISMFFDNSVQKRKRPGSQAVFSMSILLFILPALYGKMTRLADKPSHNQYIQKRKFCQLGVAWIIFK